MNNKANYTKINQELDNEHDKIFKSLYTLLNLCNINIANKTEYDVFKVNIMNGIKHTYDIAKQHWKTEQKYFNYGNKNKPYGHHNIQNEINKHVKEHTNNLKDIAKFYKSMEKSSFKSRDDVMKKIYYIKNIINQFIKQIETHINTMDHPHFSHWVRNLK